MGVRAMKLIGWTPWDPKEDAPQANAKAPDHFKGRWYPSRFYKEEWRAKLYSKSGEVKAIYVQD